jgi:hypothetical protein
MDPKDDLIQVVTVNFFDEKICLYSLRVTPGYPYVEVADIIYLDTVGRPYGICLATMNTPENIAENKDEEMLKEKLFPGEYQPESPVVNDENGFLLTKKQPQKSKLGLKSSGSCFGRATITSPTSPLLPHDESLCDNTQPTHIIISTHECSYDVSSGVSMVFDFLNGKFPMINGGEKAYNGRQVRPFTLYF